jgi:hypothetical protein
MQYLLEEQGASMTALDNSGRNVWHYFPRSDCHFQTTNPTELSSLLKIMVLLEDAPADFIAELSPQHAELCTRGRLLRAQLPSHLEQQRAAVVTNCPLPAVLQSLIVAYAITTPGPEEMWADGLCVQAPRAKRAQTKADKEDEEAEGEDTPPDPLSRLLRFCMPRVRTTATDCMMDYVQIC